MSHWSKIECEIKSITALTRAVKELKCSIVQGVEARGWGGAKRKADYTIQIPNSEFDIAVMEKDNGTFELEADTYDGSIEAVMGKDLDGLKQGYSIANVELEAEKLGHSTWREFMDNGEVNIHLTVGA